MQLGLGVLVRALANSPDSSRRCPPSGSYTMHPCHSQKAPIRESMAQEQAGVAHTLSLTVCCQTRCCWTLRLALSEHAHLHLLFPSDPRLSYELDSFNSHNHCQGCIESGQPKVEKRVKRTTHWLQLLNKPQWVLHPADLRAHLTVWVLGEFPVSEAVSESSLR